MAVGLLVFPSFSEAKKAIGVKEKSGEKGSSAGEAVLWRDPVDIKSRNLFYGPGGKSHEPHGPFTFVKEDLEGTNAKFVIEDQAGVKWKVKLGVETRPETVASRIAWAVGYYTNEDYFVSELHVNGMPRHLRRGGDQVKNGSVRNVRLKREDVKKVGSWEWNHSPFYGTREMNGLRVVMALINNWDLKDENTAIYRKGSQDIYMVSDLGASFGSASRTWPKDRSKGYLPSYESSKFLGKVTPTSVDFKSPGRPSLIYIFNPKEYFQRIHMEKIGDNIPREDVRWMGKLLSRLSPAQLRDAFRAAGYPAGEVEAFATILEQRIQALTDL